MVETRDENFEEGSSSHGTERVSQDEDALFKAQLISFMETFSNWQSIQRCRSSYRDQGLETISEGLATLKSLAQDINEEMNRQDPLIDEIDTKVERATSDLKNTNVRLKDTVTKLRSSRNFCIDIILLCVILGIAAYLYNVLKK
ncbi:hypothetical protein L7F22_050796 [Adiantum nelumboides]|nr:hypothetical protein [Adiantum nelumboides]